MASVVFVDPISGNVGVGTTVPTSALTIAGNTSVTGGTFTVDNINIRGVQLGSASLSSNAIWLPSTSLQWAPVLAPNLPVFTIPFGGTMTYSRQSAMYRWIGNDVSYNVNLQGMLTAQCASNTADFLLSVPYPVNLTSYTANTVIGELWLSTYYQNNSNTFKASALTVANNASNVAIRVLAGTAYDTLATAQSNTTMILQGTMTYQSTSFNQVGGVPAAYLPAAFYQNAAGQVLLNSNLQGGAVNPRGLLDITYNSNLPALVVDQNGTGDIVQFRDLGVSKVVVNADGNVGIGITNPQSTLHVLNATYSSTVPILTIQSRDGGAPPYNFDAVKMRIGSYSHTIGMNLNDLILSAYGDVGTYGSVVMKTNSTERLRITGDGNVGIGTVPRARLDIEGGNAIVSGSVGIGTTNPQTPLHVAGKTYINNGAVGAPANGIYGGNDGTRIVLWPGTTTGTPYAFGIDSATLWAGVPSGCVHKWYEGTTEKMSLVGGKLGIGTTAQAPLQVKAIGNVGPDLSSIYVLNSTNAAGEDAVISIRTGGSSGGNPYLSFDILNEIGWSIGIRNSDNTFRISNSWANLTSAGPYITTGGQSWTTGSDERMKDIVAPIESGLEKVCTLRSVMGKYKGTNTCLPFLIAQDVEKVLPEAVDKSNPQEWGLRYTDVIPLLVAAIKDLRNELETLKQTVNTSSS